jgi:SARP family transcriptional regulator, regulator of embCAB operon
MIEISFLQGTFLLRCDGAGVPLQPMQVKLLLALYCSGGPVESGRLVDLLWDAPTQGSNTTLRSHILRVRKKITAAGGSPDEFINTKFIGGGQCTYQLAGCVQSDAAQFSALARSGFAALARDEYHDASDQLGTALSLWGSITSAEQILPEAAKHPFAVPAREKLWRARKDAGIGKAEADISIGLHRQAAADLARMAHDWPTDREITRLRVVALYRCGRADEASEVCRLAIVAAHETGIDDAPLLKLQQALLAGALSLRDPVTVLPPRPR